MVQDHMWTISRGQNLKKQFLCEWDVDGLTSLILHISRDFSAQDARYGCFLYCTIERDMKVRVCLFHVGL